MRCSRCGNESSDTNRFCGMCGAPLRQPPVEVAGEISSRTQQANAPPATTRTPVARPANRPESPAVSDPVISGPSFLGLNQPTASTSPARSKLSIDPHSSSRNLDYLLEDEEPRGGGWKLALIFIALILAVGFGYLRWKNHGLAWLNQLSNKPSGEATQVQDPASANPSNQTQTAPGAVTPAPTSAAPPPPSSTGPSPVANSTPKDAAPAASTPVASTPTSDSSHGAGPTSPPPAAEKDNASSAPPDGDASNAKASKNAAPDDQTAKDSDSAASNDETAPDQPTPAPTKKPTPAVSRPAADTVSDAQRYLYGKGVSQDCDRGMRLLKPVATQGNPKAMIEMGALYSAGLCAPRDLPTAYRWFALALRKDPENQSVQADLQKLWGEMTQPERQLAIRLSQ